jgi:hypothetical protein
MRLQHCSVFHDSMCVALSLPPVEVGADLRMLQTAILTLINYIAFHVSHTQSHTPQWHDVNIIDDDSFFPLLLLPGQLMLLISIFGHNIYHGTYSLAC